MKVEDGYDEFISTMVSTSAVWSAKSENNTNERNWSNLHFGLQYLHDLILHLCLITISTSYMDQHIAVSESRTDLFSNACNIHEGKMKATRIVYTRDSVYNF